MLRGIYSSAAGMTTQYKKIDVLGNNISNVNTTGYKQNDVTLTTFGNELALRTSDSQAVGELPLCVYLGKENTDLSDGTLTYTGIGTDVGVFGNGFFAVRGQDGLKYTRAGNFSVDSQGFLALPNGERVLSTNGTEIQVGSDNFAVAANGTITTRNGNAGRLALFMGANNNAVSKRADGFFNIAGAQQIQGEVRQGWLENSNTDVISNMTSLMESQRAFQGSQQSMSIALQTEDKLVTEVGAVR